MSATNYVQARVTPDEHAEFRAIAARAIDEFPVLTETSVYRAALRLGMERIKGEPKLALGGATNVRTRRRSRR